MNAKSMLVWSNLRRKQKGQNKKRQFITVELCYRKYILSTRSSAQAKRGGLFEHGQYIFVRTRRSNASTYSHTNMNTKNEMLNAKC